MILLHGHMVCLELDDIHECTLTSKENISIIFRCFMIFITMGMTHKNILQFTFKLDSVVISSTFFLLYYAILSLDKTY